jgi:hypothetical protein
VPRITTLSSRPEKQSIMPKRKLKRKKNEKDQALTQRKSEKNLHSLKIQPTNKARVLSQNAAK